MKQISRRSLFGLIAAGVAAVVIGVKEKIKRLTYEKKVSADGYQFHFRVVDISEHDKNTITELEDAGFELLNVQRSEDNGSID